MCLKILKGYIQGSRSLDNLVIFVGRHVVILPTPDAKPVNQMRGSGPTCRLVSLLPTFQSRGVKVHLGVKGCANIINSEIREAPDGASAHRDGGCTRITKKKEAVTGSQRYLRKSLVQFDENSASRCHH